MQQAKRRRNQRATPPRKRGRGRATYIELALINIEKLAGKELELGNVLNGLQYQPQIVGLTETHEPPEGSPNYIIKNYT